MANNLAGTPESPFNGKVVTGRLSEAANLAHMDTPFKDLFPDMSRDAIREKIKGILGERTYAEHADIFRAIEKGGLSIADAFNLFSESSTTSHSLTSIV